MSDISDERTQHCLSFILQQLRNHDAMNPSKTHMPLFVGLSGVQGTLASLVATKLYGFDLLLTSM